MTRGCCLSALLVFSVLVPSAGNAQGVFKASQFRGANWADERDNFVDGRIVPSGISPEESIEQSEANAETLLRQLKQLLGVNTVRLGINPPTVLDGPWWSRYQRLIAAARAQELQVILACWESNSQRDGKVDNDEAFGKMWDQVVRDYSDDAGVYFEIFNEPYGYPDAVWANLAARWLQRYEPLIGEGGRRRVLVGGAGYCERLGQVGSDRRLEGCLLSFHLYSWFTRHRTVEGWSDELRKRIGEENQPRTVVTEWGVQMAGLSPKYYPREPKAGGRARTYLAAMTNVIRQGQLGSVYWPGLRDGDNYSLTAREPGSLELSVTNRSGLEQLRWSFGE